MDGSSDSNGKDGFFRHIIAWTLLFTTVVGLIALAIVVVLTATDKSAASTFVFNALLPVFGTWVGTLLAFYFSKENLDSARRNITELTKVVSGMDRLKSLPAMEKAIPLNAIFVPKDTTGQALTNLQAIVEAMKKAGRQRLLVFTSGNSVERVVHMSAIESFITETALGPAGATPLTQLTTVDLFKSPRIDKLTRLSFAFIPQDATLAEAKNAMDVQTRALGELGSCEDVFITQSGATALPVLGWITNDIINENAKV